LRLIAAFSRLRLEASGEKTSLPRSMDGRALASRKVAAARGFSLTPRMAGTEDAGEGWRFLEREGGVTVRDARIPLA
jgi:hypothetical protein